MSNKKNENLSGSYNDKNVAIIGNNKKSKPIMRDLDTVPHFEVQQAVDKIKRNQKKKRLVEAEIERQAKLEHPTIARLQPYFMLGAVIFAIFIILMAIWIIFQVNNSIDPTITPINAILMRLV